MAKEKTQTVNDQSLAEGIVEQEKPVVVEQQKPKVEQKNPEGVLIGLEAFASAKSLEWPIKVRLELYAEQIKVTEKTFDEWEKILVQL